LTGAAGFVVVVVAGLTVVVVVVGLTVVVVVVGLTVVVVVVGLTVVVVVVGLTVVVVVVGLTVVVVVVGLTIVVVVVVVGVVVVVVLVAVEAQALDPPIRMITAVEATPSRSRTRVKPTAWHRGPHVRRPEPIPARIGRRTHFLNPQSFDDRGAPRHAAVACSPQPTAKERSSCTPVSSSPPPPTNRHSSWGLDGR
jgi:hypothetical protein